MPGWTCLKVVPGWSEVYKWRYSTSKCRLNFFQRNCAVVLSAMFLVHNLHCIVVNWEWVLAIISVNFWKIFAMTSASQTDHATYSEVVWWEAEWWNIIEILWKKPWPVASRKHFILWVNMHHFNLLHWLSKHLPCFCCYSFFLEKLIFLDFYEHRMN